MNQLLRKYHKEYMKMAMLKQEETFREQVNDLHRLYCVQKLLMRDTSTADELHARRQNAPDGRLRKPAAALLDLEISADDDCSEMEVYADVELTLATRGGSWKGVKRNKANSSGSASGGSCSSSESTESGAGGGSGDESLDAREWGLWYRGPVEEAQRLVAVDVRQGSAELRPPWQLQYPSLNMT